MGLGLGKIFSPVKLVEQATKALDKMTDGQGEKADRFIDLLSAYEPFKIAQRVLAFMVIGSYVFIHLCTTIIYIAVLTKNLFWGTSMDPTPLHEVYKWNNENLLYPTLIILTFYFSGGVINGALKRLSNKSTSPNK
jgi:hypothetical protein